MRLASPQDWHTRDAETHQIVRKCGSPSKTGRDLEPNPRSGHVHRQCLALLIPLPRASLLEFQNPGVMSSREVDVLKAGCRRRCAEARVFKAEHVGVSLRFLAWTNQCLCLCVT